MSQIGDLIEDQCGDGVPYRELGEVAAYSDTRVDARTLDGGTFVGVDNLLPDKAGKATARYFPNTARLAAYEPGDVLLGNIRPYLKKIWLADNAGGCSGDILAIRIRDNYRQRISSEFLYYLLSSDSFFAFNVRHSKGGKMPRGSKADILRYQIPIPPVGVQREIVRILDSFTSLEAELEAELKKRRQQYAHYRHVLLTSPEAGAVRWATMGEVLSLRAGKFISSADIHSEADDEHPYPCFGGNGLRGYVAGSNQDGDYVLVGRQGAWSGNVKRVSGRFYATEHALVVTPLENFDTSWLFHELTVMNLNQYVSQGAQPGLAVGNLNKILIPVPEKMEQARVGLILDQFDTLVNDLRSGLPAEIKARRRQYGYYRDRLLTFEEAVG